MTNAILLSLSALSGFSPATQSEVMDYIKSQLSIEEGAPSAGMEEEDEPADLSVAQVKKFVERCSDKTRTALRVIAEADASGFTLPMVAKVLGVDLDVADLRGVWGGITKRVRTVLDDPEANLIWWVQDDQNQWIGHVSAMTHRSMRKAFAL